MWETLANIFKIQDLKKRIIFTLTVLVIFRLGTHIPLPGINTVVLAEFFNSRSGNLLSFFNTFSGGALKNLSIFTLGVIPYISASIIMQLMIAVFPFLERLSKEGDTGRTKITRYTRYFAIILSFVQAIGITAGMRAMTSPSGQPIVLDTLSPLTFNLICIVTLTTGTAFVMWLGEQISERGIGNGISLIIFAGIVSDIPFSLVSTAELFNTGEITLFTILLVTGIIIAVIFLIIYFETAVRRIPVQYPRRVIGRNVVGGQSSFFPLKINSSGVIPPIFASSLLAFPATITAFVETPWIRDIGANLTPDRLAYNILFVVLIFFFAFFYTAIQFNPVKLSEELKKYGGIILNIRPGKKTAEYLNFVLTRLTFFGAVYLSAVCVLPVMLYNLFSIPFFFGGTALLIVIGVALDTANQLETQLVHQNYEGFLNKKVKNKY